MNFSKPLPCKEEMRVIRSARTGFWDAGLEQHVASCPACSEAAAMARLLNEMRAVDESQCRIPDSGLMWWKAQLLARREAGEDATQPISFVERFSYVLGGVCAIAVCILQWHAIRGWLISLGQGGWKMGSAYLGEAASQAQRVFSSAASTGPNWLTQLGLPVATGAAILGLFTAIAVYLAHLEE